MTGFDVDVRTQLPQQTYARLYQLAREHDTTVESLVRECVRRQLAGAPSVGTQRLADLPPAEIASRKWSPEHDEIVIALNKAGMADNEIAKRMGLSAQTINNHRRALGLDRNFHSRWAGKKGTS